MKNRIVRFLGVTVVLSTISTSPAQVTGKWSFATGNWSATMTPVIGASNDLAILAGALGGNRTLTVDAPVSLGAMYIGHNGNQARAATLAGSAITFTNLTGGVAWLVKTNNANVAASSTDAINVSIVLGSSLAVSNNSSYGGLTLSGSISEVGGSRALYVGTSIANSNRIGITGNNSFSGGVFLRSGALQIGHVNALGTGALTMYGGGLGASADLSAGSGVTNAIVLAAAGVVSNQNALQLSGGIGGAFSLAKWGTAALTLSGSNSFSGGSSLRAGTLLLGNVNALGTGTLMIDGGVLGASANLSAGTGVTNAIALGAAGIVSNVNALQLSGNIGGGFSLTKKAAGTLVLAGTNTFSGPLTVSNGMVQVARQVSLYNNTPASWTAANIIVATNTTLALNVGGAGEFTTSEVQTIAALGTGSGGFADGSFLGLDTTGGDFTHNNAIDNPNTGANVLGLVKLGANALTLGGPNTYTGGTTVNAGILKIGAAERLADTGVLTVNNGGTFDLNGNDETVWYLAGTAGGVITNTGAMADLILDLQDCGNKTFNGNIVGDIRLTVQNSQTIKDGTVNANQDYQALTGTNAFTGGIVIDGGVLRVATDLRLGAVPASFDADNITLKNGGTLVNNDSDLVIDANRGIFLESGTGVFWTGWSPKSIEVRGTISGPGSLGKFYDSGVLLLMASNTYEGITSITQGTVRVGNDAAFSTNTVFLQGITPTLTVVSNDARTLANAMVVGTNVSLGAATVHTGALTLTGPTDLGGAVRTLNVYSGVEISGSVSNGGLARAQTGTLTLSGSNTYGLGTTLGDSSGRLRVGNDDALGLGTVTMGRTTLTATGGVARVLTNHFVLTQNPTFGAASVDNGALTLNSIDLNVATRTVTNLSALTVSGVVSNGHLTKRGAGVLTLAGANTFTNLSLDAGVLALAANDVVGVGIVDFQGGQIQSADGTARTITNRVTVSSGATTWGAAGTGDLIFNGSAWNNGAAAKALYVSNNLTTINAPWTNNNASVTKLGPGILAFGSTLAGSNWIVNGGTLRLDAGGDMSNVAAAVTLGADAIFDVAAKSGWQMLGQQAVKGSGSVVGDVLSADGAQFLPGDAVTIGTLTFSNALTLTSGSASTLDLGTLTGIGGGTNDLIAVVGALTAGSSRIVVNPLQPLTTGSGYRLFTYGSLVGSFGGVDVPGTRYSGVLAEGGGAVDATFSGSPLAITWSGSAAAGVAGSTWDVTNNVNWQAGAEKFYTMDSVTFDESSPSGTVTLTGTIQPQSIVVAGASNYTFTGSGRITASTGILKTGAGVLTVSTANDFDGDVVVSNGTVRAGNSLALGSVAGATRVASGATFDVGGAFNFSNERFYVAGTGVNGAGAIVNSGGAAGDAMGLVTLTGDTTFGGSGNWDFSANRSQAPVLDGGGFDLTKVGGNQIKIKSTSITNMGDIVLSGGSLKLEVSTTINPEGTITLNPGTFLALYRLAAPIQRDIFATDARIWSDQTNAAGQNILGGTLTLAGTVTNDVDVDSSLTFDGAVVGAGAMYKAGAGTLTLGGTNTYSGATTIANGILALGPNASISNTPSITMAAGKLLDVSQVAGGWTLYDHQTLSGAASVAGNVTALGTIKPGASAGTMVYSNDLTLSGADLEFELSNVGTVGGGVNDLIDVKGSLALTGVNALTVVPLANTLASSYTVMTYGGALTGNEVNLTAVAAGVRAGYSFTFSTNTAGSVIMNVSGAPASGDLVWDAGDGTWDLTNTVAWAGGEKFYQTDLVTFSDAGATGGDTNVVTFSERLLPGGIAVNSASNYLFTGSGHLAGTAGLTKNGTGLLILGTSNELTGATAILDGRVVLGHAGALRLSAVSNAVNGGLGFSGGTAFTIASLSGAGDIALTNAAGAAVTLTLGGNNAGTVFGGALGGGSGALTKNGTGTLTLTNSLAISGFLMQNAGTIVLGGPGTNILGSDLRVATDSIASIVQNDGITVASGGNGILVGNGTGANGAYTLNGGILVTHPAGDNRGVILGANSGSTGTFNLVGGTVTGKILEVSRSDANSPRSVGYFYQSGGTAAFANVTVAGGSVGNSSNNAALLAVSNGTFMASAFGGFASGNASTGRIYLGAGALVTLPAFPTARGTNAYAELTFDGGTLTPLAASAAYMHNLTKVFLTTNGAIFNVPTGRNITVGSATQPLENASGQLGRLTKTGDGVLTLNGTNTYGGLTAVGAGALLIGSTNALPGLYAAGRYAVSNGAVLAVPNAVTETEVTTMLGTGNFLANSFIGFDTSADSRTNGNVVANLGGNPLGLAKLGANTLLVTNDHTYTGGTKIFAGTLQVGDGGTIGSLGAGAIQNQGALLFNRSDALSVGGVISGTGTLTQAGSGVLTLGAASLYTGITTVQQGTVRSGIDNALPATSALVLGKHFTAGTLDLASYDQTLGGLSVVSTNAAVTNSILIGAGKTLTVLGNVSIGSTNDSSTANLVASGGGTLAVTTNGGTFRTGVVNLGTDRSGKTTVDFSGLGAFLMDLGTGSMTISANGDNNGNDRNIMILSASNVLRAASISVGSTPIGSPNQLRLGSGTNILYVNNLNLGTVNRDSGQLLFNGAGGGILLRDLAGTGRANVTIGTNASTTGAWATNIFDVTGHPADLLIDTLTIGALRRAGTSTNGFAFDQGVLDASTVVMAQYGTNSVSALRIGGGTASIGSLSLSGGGPSATGTLAITGGTVTMGGNISQQTGGRGILILNGGTLDLQGNNIGTGGVALTALNLQSGTLKNVGQINNGAAWTKTGAGRLTLEGNNLFTGAITVNTGVLAAASVTALGTTAGGVTVLAGGTLGLQGGITISGETVILTGVGGVDGPATAAGALRNISGNNTWAGGITVTGSVDTALFSEEGHLLITGDITDNRTGGNLLLRGNGSGEIGGVISGARTLFKSAAGATNAGTWTLSGLNTYSGSTTIAAGTLRISSEANLGTTPASYVAGQISLRGGFLQNTASMTISPNRGVQVGTSGGGFDTTAGTAQSIESIISGVGGNPLVKTGDGTLQLSGNNTYDGPTYVSNGTLRVNGVHSGGGIISVYSGAALAGTGSVAAVTVAGGGGLRPGNSAGTLTVVGDLTLDGGATLEYDLGTTSDLILAGTTILGGIDFDNFTFLPGLGFGPGVYTLVNATAISGLGAGTTGTVGGLGATLSIDAGNQDLVLTVIPEPATLGLLGLCAAAALLRRRLRR